MSLLSLARRPGIVARRHACSAAAAALALSPAVAPAVAHADQAAETPLPLEGVVVTASGADYRAASSLAKLPADLKDIPQSVTVLDRSLLQSQGVTSLADALKNVPGITLGGAEGGQIGNNINLNGFAARTDIYMDGFRDRGQYYRDTFALEQVEVLMGPSSMLFGRGSTGGAINQVSKQPGPMAASEVSLSATSNGLVRGTGDVNAPLGDRAALRISAMGQQGAASTRRKTTVKDYGVAPAYRWGLHSDLEVSISALLQHNDDRPDYGQPPLNGEPAKVGRDTVYGYSDDRTIQDIRAVAAEVKKRFASGLQLRNRLQFNGVDTDARETAPQGIGTVGAKGYAALSPAGTSALPPSQLWVALQSHDRTIRDTSLFDQAEASGRFTVAGMRNDGLAGVEFGRDTYSNQAYSRTGACNGVALKSGQVSCTPLLAPAYTASPTLSQTAGNLAGGRADTAAVYASDTLSLTPQLKLVGGVRFDHYAATVTNSVASARSPARASQTVNAASVRGGALWQPDANQTYYLSYSTSFNPSLEQLTSTTGASEPLPPEANEAYEAGGKWTVLAGRLDLNAAVFRITKSNARTQNPDSTYTADGTVRVDGARVSAAGEITRRWRLFAGYSWLDAEIVDAIAPDTQGKVPANTPRDSATLWTTYDLPHHLQVGGGAIYVGSRYLNNSDLVSVPGYVRIDATLAWRRKTYEVRLNVFNLADARYYDGLIPSDGGRAVPGSGRTAMISLVWRP